MAHDIKTIPTDAKTPSSNIVALPHRAEAMTPSEKAIGFVKRHPVLTVAGGLAAGLVISALIPRSYSRRLAKRALGFAEAGATAALALGHEAVDKAESGSIIARKKAGIFASRAEKLSEKALDKAERLGVAALGSASVWGHAAADRAERLGHAAAERAETFGGRASDRLSQLGDKALAKSNKLIAQAPSASTLGDRIVDKAHDIKARIRG